MYMKNQLHKIIYYGDLSASDLKKAERKTQEDNSILDKLATMPEESVTLDVVKKQVILSGYYDTANDEQIKQNMI